VTDAFTIVVLVAGGILGIVAFAVAWLWRATKQLAKEARHDLETKVKLAERFPLLLKMDKLADHDLEALLNDAPDDVLQFAALGLALFAARGDNALEDLIEKKAEFLSGELVEDQMLEHLANAFVEASCREHGGQVGFSAKERAVHAGCALNGAAAFATALKHLVEAHREERRKENEQQGQKDAA
jgi:hypothetical protein